jgi:hypothetical protein
VKRSRSGQVGWLKIYLEKLDVALASQICERLALVVAYVVARPLMAEGYIELCEETALIGTLSFL